VSSVQRRFEDALDRLALAPGRVLVAVSGGSDSIALLDLFAGVAPQRGFELIVVHYDHGIDPRSGAVADQVRGLAQRYALPFQTAAGRLGPSTTETTARRARLAWFADLLAKHRPAIVATGHQADDQVETLLMRFLEGSGSAGLAGIAEKRGRYVRPLLQIRRAELAAHVARIGIEPWIDPANADPRHLRSWLRLEILPKIDDRLPSFRERLMAARTGFEAERDGWESLAKELPLLDFREESRAVSVAASPLAGYSSTIVRPVLKGLGRRLSVGLGSRSIDRLQRLLVLGDTGQIVDLVAGLKGELSFGRLRLFFPIEHPTGELTIDSATGSGVLEPWRIEWDIEGAPDQLQRGGFRTWLEPDAVVRVRPWRAGDRIRPLRGRGARLVVRCMQEAKVPRSRRSHWPVVEHRGDVVWVPGVCRSEVLVPAPGTRARRIDVCPS
jgi:tRNA(Ile)-lysidine synthase